MMGHKRDEIFVHVRPVSGGEASPWNIEGRGHKSELWRWLICAAVLAKPPTKYTQASLNIIGKEVTNLCKLFLESEQETHKDQTEDYCAERNAEEQPTP